MKTVVINEYIGTWGFNEIMIEDQLAGLIDEEEIEIRISSPGGSIFTGIVIFNRIRELAKTHDITVKIVALCASIASYIAVAPRTINPNAKIVISENAIFVIHNPYIMIEGDYRELQKEAKTLEKLAAMFATTYAFVSKQEEKQIRFLMDADSWFIGKEILENGFATDFEEINKDENQSQETLDSLKINARMEIRRAFEKTKSEYEKGDNEKAVALVSIPFMEKQSPEHKRVLNMLPSSHRGEVKRMVEKEQEMTPEELKAKSPDCYNTIIRLGAKEALDKERERVIAHLDAGKAASSMEVADKYIRDGSSMLSEKVQSDYLAANMKNAHIKARNDDNPGDIKINDTNEDDETLLAVFHSGYTNGSFRFSQGEKQ
jgi:ATP-dependent protease ClpP protease subunit